MLENKISIRKIKKLSEEDLEKVVGGGKLKNVAIRTGGVLVGTVTGALCGALIHGVIGGYIECNRVDRCIKHAEKNENEDLDTLRQIQDKVAINATTTSASTGLIVGAIAGAIKGYKIAGKWCD